VLQCELRVNAHTRQAIDSRRILTVAFDSGRGDFEFRSKPVSGRNNWIILIYLFYRILVAFFRTYRLFLPVIPLAA